MGYSRWGNKDIYCDLKNKPEWVGRQKPAFLELKISLFILGLLPKFFLFWKQGEYFMQAPKSIDLFHVGS